MRVIKGTVKYNHNLYTDCVPGPQCIDRALQSLAITTLELFAFAIVLCLMPILGSTIDFCVSDSIAVWYRYKGGGRVLYRVLSKLNR